MSVYPFQPDIAFTESHSDVFPNERKNCHKLSNENSYQHEWILDNTQDAHS